MSPPVLIVGAGPAGLTAACALHRDGVPCRIIDRRPAPGTAPKALVLWSGALEVLSRVGAASDIVARALPLAGASYHARGRRLGWVGFGSLPGTRFPGPLCVPQPIIEAALHRALRRFGAEVEWGTELIRVTDLSGLPGPTGRTGSAGGTGPRADTTDGAGDGWRVELRTGGGATERAEARWLVGADGTHSRVREALGIAFQGHTYQRTFLLGDGVLTGPAPTDEAQYHLHPDGVLVMVPLPGGGHRVFFDVARGGTRDPAADGDARTAADGGGVDPAGSRAPDRAALQSLLDRRGPGGLRLTELWWSSRFLAHVRLAGRFRRGRGFLVGDAAHCHSPAGGQGLNTGVQDGYDLGWKLAGVWRGADESLLDSYQAERRPASARAVRNADRQTRLWMVRSGWGRLVRDGTLRYLFRRGLLARRMVPQLAQLDLDHSASPATVDLPGSAPAAVRRGRRMPDTRLHAADGPPTLHHHLARGRHAVVVAGDGAAGEAVAEAAAWVADRGVADVVDVLWLRPPATGVLPGPVPTGAEVLTEHAPAPLSGGREPWLALVRPDGVVACRGRPDRLAALLPLLPQRPAADRGVVR